MSKTIVISNKNKNIISLLTRMDKRKKELEDKMYKKIINMADIAQIKTQPF